MARQKAAAQHTGNIALLGLRGDEHVLDVACGTGHAALAVAHSLGSGPFPTEQDSRKSANNREQNTIITRLTFAKGENSKKEFEASEKNKVGSHANQLAHSDSRMTQRYAHLLPENQNMVGKIDGTGTTTVLLQ